MVHPALALQLRGAKPLFISLERLIQLTFVHERRSELALHMSLSWRHFGGLSEKFDGLIQLAVFSHAIGKIQQLIGIAGFGGNVVLHFLQLFALALALVGPAKFPLERLVHARVGFDEILIELSRFVELTHFLVQRSNIAPGLKQVGTLLGELLINLERFVALFAEPVE